MSSYLRTDGGSVEPEPVQVSVLIRTFCRSFLEVGFTVKLSLCGDTMIKRRACVLGLSVICTLNANFQFYVLFIYERDIPLPVLIYSSFFFFFFIEPQNVLSFSIFV